MKRLFIYILFLSGICSLQAKDDVVKYDSAPSSAINEACKGFVLQPGFSFKATSGSSMAFRINTNSCDASQTTTNISSNQNYIVTLTPLGQTQAVSYVDGKITVDRKIEGDVDVLTQIQYFDGLGRPIQTVQRGVTPSKSDLVTYQEYDPVGRESNVWLPTAKAGNNGAFVPLANVTQLANSQYGDLRPFSEPVYEASPLNRVIRQYGPGEKWNNSTLKKPISTEYLTNSGTTGELSCIIFNAIGSGVTTSLSKGSYYNNGELYVTKMTDEDGNISYEFKDKQGQVVLVRQINEGASHDTYYAFDDFGNLSYVLPPLGTEAVLSTGVTVENLDTWAFMYKYDDRNRCVRKKLPGLNTLWMYFVYDKADRLIFSQDGEQRDRGEWAFSIPDVFGRVVLSGKCNNTITVDNHVTYLKDKLVVANFNLNNSAYQYYDVSGITLATPTVFTANYYDNYDFMTKGDFPKLAYTAQPAYGTQYNNSKGLLTGSQTFVFDGSGYLSTALYYDYKGNVIQSKSTNHLGGVESEYIAYTFAGSPTKKLHIHAANGKTTQTELYTYAYDHVGRLKTTKHQLNNGNEVILASNNYDELGRILSSTPNNQASLTINYTYNIRSWINTIKSPHFNQTLDYTYNGNINTQEWGQANKVRKYTFAYDNLSRIKSAIYTNPSFPDEKFSETLTYDKQGNFTSIEREGSTGSGTYGTIDKLSFGYTGNQLKYVNDAAPDIALSGSADFKNNSNTTNAEYDFNKNGAMTEDLNRGTAITYNSLNLPQQVDIKSTEGEATKLYTYSASGIKLRVSSSWNPKYSVSPMMGVTTAQSSSNKPKVIDYVSNKIYEDGILKRILTDNGYIEGNTYYFYIKDHLGNNRIVANSSGSVIQSTEYYPFGMTFAESTNQGAQPYKYNGKELDQDHGLNWYDYSARYLTNDVPRFTTIDPHSENYYSWSPYVYVGNNPMRLTDPDGKDWRDFLNGIVDGAKQRVEAYANAVAHPIETIQNMANQPAPSIGEVIVNATDNITMGSVSSTVNAIKAVSTDVNGGNGSASGQYLGSLAADAGIAVVIGKAGEAVGKGVSALSKGAAQNEITTVGRWMSKTEYSTMSKTGQMIEGAGGKTSVTTGADTFKGAAKGSVYAEFGVPTNSLVQGGQANWFSVVGPNSNKVMQATVQKQGGLLINEIQIRNLTPILKTK